MDLSGNLFVFLSLPPCDWLFVFDGRAVIALHYMHWFNSDPSRPSHIPPALSPALILSVASGVFSETRAGTGVGPGAPGGQRQTPRAAVSHGISRKHCVSVSLCAVYCMQNTKKGRPTHIKHSPVH